MNKRLGGDHAVEQLSPGIASGGDNPAVSVGANGIELERLETGVHRVQPDPSVLTIELILVLPAFQFDARHNG